MWKSLLGGEKHGVVEGEGENNEYKEKGACKSMCMRIVMLVIGYGHRIGVSPFSELGVGPFPELGFSTIFCFELVTEVSSFCFELVTEVYSSCPPISRVFSCSYFSVYQSAFWYLSFLFSNIERKQ